MAPLIILADVEERLEETLAAPESAKADSLIVYASSRLRRLVDSLDTRVADWDEDPRPATALDPELVKGAMVSAVVRALIADRNGRGIKSVEYPEVKTTYSGEDPEVPAAVYFTDEELRDLALAPVGRSGAAAFTVGTAWAE